MTFVCFMAGPLGRSIRVVVGLALMSAGYFLKGSPAGVALMIGGSVPFLTSTLNFCPFGSLCRASIRNQAGPSPS